MSEIKTEYFVFSRPLKRQGIIKLLYIYIFSWDNYCNYRLTIDSTGPVRSHGNLEVCKTLHRVSF